MDESLLERQSQTYQVIDLSGDFSQELGGGGERGSCLLELPLDKGKLIDQLLPHFRDAGRDGHGLELHDPLLQDTDSIPVGAEATEEGMVAEEVLLNVDSLVPISHRGVDADGDVAGKEREGLRVSDVRCQEIVRKTILYNLPERQDNIPLVGHVDFLDSVVLDLDQVHLAHDTQGSLTLRVVLLSEVDDLKVKVECVL